MNKNKPKLKWNQAEIPFLRCGSAKQVAEGKIPWFKLLSCRQDRYGQGRAINEPSGLESGNRSISSLETQMVRRRWIPVQIGLNEEPRYACTRIVGCLGCGGVPKIYKGGSKTNDHSRKLTVPVVTVPEDRTINESQVSGIYIQQVKRLKLNIIKVSLIQLISKIKLNVQMYAPYIYFSLVLELTLQLKQHYYIIIPQQFSFYLLFSKQTFNQIFSKQCFQCLFQSLINIFNGHQQFFDSMLLKHKYLYSVLIDCLNLIH
ncbi:Hypothetical_protein [Hexamita inflata]|uniref:Hypothetical_protein n=1 Tax=Hexamita inflata TaxID=28002 RepID=A0AA86UMD9_9EUKA|nr:Hypothetical protein HINF_LOCUS32358 [Hexamita inflata]